MKVKGRESRVEGQNRGIALRSNRGFRHATLGYRFFNTPLVDHSGPRPSTLDARPFRGMTLIELLVVIVIITTLVAAAIPLISPSNDDRRLREAARNLNSFINGAQAQAIAKHRPVGIALKRLSQDTSKVDDRGVCVELYYVEQ